MPHFRTPEELLDYWYEAFQREDLGLRYIGYADERLNPEYPCITLGSPALSRDIHATQQFVVFFTFNMWIYHANLNANHRNRSKQDLELVTRVRDFMHDDFTCSKFRNGDKGTVQSWITDETPGLTPRERGGAVITTRIGWVGRAIVPFSI
jgi:hypothetical protein